MLSRTTSSRGLYIFFQETDKPVVCNSVAFLTPKLWRGLLSPCSTSSMVRPRIFLTYVSLCLRVMLNHWSVLSSRCEYFILYSPIWNSYFPFPFLVKTYSISHFQFPLSISHSPFPVLVKKKFNFPFSISHSPFPIPHSPFPIPRFSNVPCNVNGASQKLWYKRLPSKIEYLSVWMNDLCQIEPEI